MTVSSIILDLRGPNPIITNPNIVSMTVDTCPTVEVIAVTNICEWIQYKGGWNEIAAYDIMTLVDAYLGLINIGYTVRMQDINGCVAYYLGLLDSGNSFTGCSFT